MSRISRHCDTRFEELAGVGLVLRRNSHWHRLQALEPRRGLKMRALLATMQGGRALRTVPLKVDIGRQRGRATVAAGRRDRLHHPRQPRTSYINRRAWTLRTRT